MIDVAGTSPAARAALTASTGPAGSLSPSRIGAQKIREGQTPDATVNFAIAGRFPTASGSAALLASFLPRSRRRLRYSAATVTVAKVPQ